jgi:hypothetical protein
MLLTSLMNKILFNISYTIVLIEKNFAQVLLITKIKEARNNVDVISK